MGGLSMLLLAGEHALTNKEAGYKLVFDQHFVFVEFLFSWYAVGQPFKPVLFSAVDPFQH